VHQCAGFSSDPKVKHVQAIMWIGRYLLATRDKGIIMAPNNNKSFNLSVDADFCGNWDQSKAAAEDAARSSRYGFLISYAGCLSIDVEVGGSTIQHRIGSHWSVGGSQGRDTTHGTDEGARGARFPNHRVDSKDILHGI
jgi:hypothetical protein